MLTKVGVTYQDWVRETADQAWRYRAMRAFMTCCVAVALVLAMVTLWIVTLSAQKPAPARVGAPILLEWDAVEGAESYRVTVLSNGHRWPWDVREPRMLIPAPLVGQVFEVRVAAVINGEASSPASVTVVGRSKMGTSQAPSAPIRVRIRRPEAGDE
jgi:hypothetical protein